MSYPLLVSPGIMVSCAESGRMKERSNGIKSNCFMVDRGSRVEYMGRMFLFIIY